MTIIVFTGPTLSAKRASAEFGVICHPPVRQGDLYRAALGGPMAIGIIDGLFEQVPSVWHKEILWAMSQGIHVFGSASMGALRAAELAPFGMVGVGEIFEAYRDGRLTDDDEVALRHGPAETGYLAVSEPMVNIRATLPSAAQHGIIRDSTGRQLERIAKDLFYPMRSYPHILELGLEAGLPNAEIACLRDWLPDGRIDQKRRDAIEMLRAMKSLMESRPEPKRVDFRLELTDKWDAATQIADASPLTPTPRSSTPR